jgi:hypothetical protein
MTRRNFFSVLLTAPVLFWNRLKGTVTPTASLPLPAPPIKRNHEEWLRCKADPVYFLEQHFKIVNSTEGLIPVKLLPWQKEVAYAYQEKNVVANVARQSGKNVIVAGLILHRLLFFENAVIGVVSPKMMTTADLLQMLKLAYEQLPEWLRPGVLRWNRENVLLVNGNRLVCFAGREPFRGYSLTDVFVNEAAYCEESVIQNGVIATINGGRYFVISSPNGWNHFAKRYLDLSHNQDPTVHTIHVQWGDVPGRTYKWKEDYMRTIGERQFRQEFDAEFLRDV